MRVKKIFEEIPDNLPAQLKMLIANSNIDYAEALEYLKRVEFAKARDLKGPRTDKQLLEELIFEVKENLGKNYEQKGSD